MTDVVSMIPTPDQQNPQVQMEEVATQNQDAAVTMDQQAVESQTDGVNSQHQNSQTDQMAVDIAEIQTDQIISEHRHQQTDKIPLQDHNMQTVVDTQTTKVQAVVDTNTTKVQAVVDTNTTEMQTTPKVEHQKAQQTEVKVFTTIDSQTEIKTYTTIDSQTEVKVSHNDSQTEFNVRIVPESIEQQTQAGSWNPQDNVSQTDLSMSLMVEGGCQVATDVIIGQCQTDTTATGDVDTQTSVDTLETSTQAVVEVQEAVCQAVVQEVTSDAQTDISLFNVADGSAQAVVVTAYAECQATTECYVQEIQTDSSMALLMDNDAQATVDMAEGGIQTDAAQLTEQYIQTELVTDQKFSQTDNETTEMDVQAVVTMVAMDTQTDVEVIEDLPQVYMEPPQLIVEPSADVPDIATAEVSISSDSQVLMNSQSSVVTMGSMDMGPVVQIEPREFNEESSQTDPVTIIIGDASFLVKKLRSSALSPTKVSSMGNEIEIELRADDDEEQYEEFDQPQHIVPSAARGSRGGSRARGVRTRGGPRGSPRGRHVAPILQKPGYYAATAGNVGKYSCPICSDTFHESPALYEHLQLVHREAFSLIKKPRGREGKTIKIKPQPDAEPPLLTPMEPSAEQQQQALLQQQLMQQQLLEQQQLEQQQLEQQQAQMEQQQQQAQEQLQQHLEEQNRLEEEQRIQEEQEMAQQEEIHPHIQVEHLEHVELTEDPDDQEVIHEQVHLVQPVNHEQVIEVEEGNDLTTHVIVPDHEGNNVGLFEDSNWTPNKSRKRTLARRQITDEDDMTLLVEEQQTEYQIVIQPQEAPKEPAEEDVHAKRKRSSLADAGVRKRVRSEEEEVEEVSEETPRRRSSRAIKVEKSGTEDTPSPRKRGRPRKDAKLT